MAERTHPKSKAHAQVNPVTKGESTPAAVQDKMPIYFVLYCKKDGIYLGADEDGKSLWSLTNPSGRDKAPVFRKGTNEANDYVKEHDDPDHFHEHEAREVVPDSKGFASIEACANASLPRWDPNAKAKTPSTPEEHHNPDTDEE